MRAHLQDTGRSGTDLHCGCVLGRAHCRVPQLFVVFCQQPDAWFIKLAVSGTALAHEVYAMNNVYKRQRTFLAGGTKVLSDD